MSDITNQEIKELLVGLSQQITLSNSRVEEQYHTLDQRIGTLDQRIDTLDQRIDILDKKIDAQTADFDKKIEALDKQMQIGFTEIKGEFKRLDVDLRRVEETFASKIDGMNKRVDTQEFFNRGVILAAIGGTLGAVAKVLFFPNPGS